MPRKPAKKKPAPKSRRAHPTASTGRAVSVKSSESIFSHLPNLRMRAFLSAYSECGMVIKAAGIAGVHRDTHYRWLANDPQYAEAFQMAKTLAGDALEDEAVRRAQLGVEKGVWHNGKRVGKERVYSDTLLMFVLNGLRPEKYKQRTANEHSGPGGAPIQTETKVNAEVGFDLTKLDPEEFAQFSRLANKAAVTDPNPTDA